MFITKNIDEVVYMNHYKTTIPYIVLAFSVILMLYSCEGLLTDPLRGPSDERILFIKFDDTITEICSIRPDGNDPYTITRHNTAGEYIRQGYHHAQWSPDKRRIAIVGGPRESHEVYPIWLMDNQGNLIYRLTWNGHSPNWSSNGNEILFSRRRDYFSLLVDYYIVNVHSLYERQVIKADSFSWSGSDWSTDGNYVLTHEQYYWIDEEGKQRNSDQEVVLLKMSTKDKLQLTDTDAMDFGAQLSPDDSKIVYISGKYGSGYQIKLMNADGSDKSTLVDTLAAYNTIRWSPDGDKIAYNKRDKLDGYVNYAEGSDIFVIDVNSGEIKQLTNFAADSIIVYVQDWK